MIFKVDYAKAYDSVKWGFLIYMMRRMKFSEKWISWVRGYLESASVSVLVNGSPSSEFGMGKGLRQGDPMALFLFLIVAEGLSGLMRQALLNRMFTGYRMGRRQEEEVSLLQFADDTLFVGEATTRNAFTLKCVLCCFKMASGLKVNFHKSKLIGVSVDCGALRSLAGLLNCHLTRLPFVYLEIPVGGNPRRLSFWDPVVEKLRRRFSTWRSKQLTFGGRLCLVNNTLASIPLYCLSVSVCQLGL